MTAFLLVHRQRWEKEVGRTEAVCLDFSFIMFSPLFVISVVLSASSGLCCFLFCHIFSLSGSLWTLCTIFQDRSKSQHLCSICHLSKRQSVQELSISAHSLCCLSYRLLHTVLWGNDLVPCNDLLVVLL